MKIVGLSLVSFLAFNCLSQNQKISNTELKKVTFSHQQATNSSDSVRVYSDYIIDPEKLKLAFVSGEIPADAPKYDNSLDFKTNIEIGKAWARQNKHLIKPEHWSKFEN